MSEDPHIQWPADSKYPKISYRRFPSGGAMLADTLNKKTQLRDSNYSNGALLRIESPSEVTQGIRQSHWVWFVFPWARDFRCYRAFRELLNVMADHTISAAAFGVCLAMEADLPYDSA